MYASSISKAASPDSADRRPRGARPRRRDEANRRRGPLQTEGADIVFRSDLAADPRSVCGARSAARRALEACGRRALSGDSDLLASKSIANAVEHGDGTSVGLALRGQSETQGQPAVTRGKAPRDAHGQQPQRRVLPEPRRSVSSALAGQVGEPSDADLLRQHVAGDPDAFGSLFHRHRGRLWAVAVRTLGDPEEAADALQDAMIAALRRAGSFRGDSAVTTWLYRIVVNSALDRIRRRAARPASSGHDEDALDVLATGSQPLGDPSASTDTTLDVRAALSTLAPDQRAALVLVDMLGYSIADAAEILCASEGTVKSRAARGRARLVPQLAHLRPAVPEHDRGKPAADRARPARASEGVTASHDPPRPATERGPSLPVLPWVSRGRAPRASCAAWA